MFKVIEDKQATDETIHREKVDETIDTRPMPANQVRHLDVNEILERSLPRWRTPPEARRD